MKYLVLAVIGAIISQKSTAEDTTENFLRRYQVDNCLKVTNDVSSPAIRKGDIVKINGSRLGQFQISRALTTTAEIVEYCKKGSDIDSIGWLPGKVFEKWPEIILVQNENDPIEKCFVIDGPANVRDNPKGKIVDSVNDFAVSKVLRTEGDWLLISEPIKPLFNEHYYPLRCLTSMELKPIGWTHKSNLKSFPHPLFLQADGGIRLLLNKKPIMHSLSKSELGMGVLSMEFFKSGIDGAFWGALVINRGDMERPDAYFFSNSRLVRIDYEGEWVAATDEGLVVTWRGPQSADGSCEVTTTLIQPDRKRLLRKEARDVQFCGAG